MKFVLAILPLCLFSADHLDQLRGSAPVPLQAETHHVQGIDTAGDSLWVSSVDAPGKRGFLFVFNRRSGKLKSSVEVQAGERFHPGGISLDGNSIWVPVAEYRRSSTSTIQRRDTGTLALKTEFAVNDHIGAIAIVKEGLVGANWDARDFYVWTKDGVELRKIANPTGIAVQDMKVVNGTLIASGLRKDKSGAIVWLQWPSLRVLRTMEVGRTDRGIAFTHEGFAVERDTLFFLPEDGPSRLFAFRPR